LADKRTGDRSADPLKETSPPRRPIANVDCYSRAIVGWHAATVKDTAMVTTALKMALWRRDHADRSVASGLIHHSDAGSQYTSIAFAESCAGRDRIHR
jgi:transposase InsO family protein